MATSDPIRKRYFDAVERADKAADWLFYIAAVLSLASLFVEPSSPWYRLVMVPFAVAVVLVFALGTLSRMFLMPRADQKRRQDFLSHALGVDLGAEKTDGYYNTALSEGPKRLAAQLLENSFFTKELTRHMTLRHRAKLLLYAGAWMTIVIVRDTDFGVILAVTQFIFSEQIIARCIRVEWLRAKSERVYDEIYRLFQARAPARQFLPQALDSLLTYETAKSTAGVVIPSKLFDRLNASLSQQWDAVRARLTI